MRIRMTYAWPERLRVVDLAGDRQAVERVPNSPTRPARAWEPGGWWEDVPLMTPEQAEAQRRSFVYGNCKIDNEAMTRAIVDAAARARNSESQT